MGAAQIIFIALYGVSLLSSAYLHGKPREGKWNIWSTLIGTAIGATLLWWGGFWT